MHKNLTDALAAAAVARTLTGFDYSPEQNERRLSAPAERKGGPMFRLAP